MRNFCLIVPSFFLLCHCTDITEIPAKPSDENKRVTPQISSQQAPKSPFPLERIIADASGRTINVKVTAKQAGEIGVIKVGSYTPFVLSISKLSEQDQAYLNTLKNGGDMGAIKTLVERYQKFTAERRVANWNPQFYNAEKEATNLGVPLLTAFLITDDPESQGVEKNILFNRDFRNYANMNLALCLLKLDSTQSQKISSISAGDNRKIADNFGVNNQLALFLSVPGGSPIRVPITTDSNVQSAIDMINRFILKL